MKRAVNFLVLSAISIAAIGHAAPAKAERSGDEQREMVRNQSEHQLIMETLKYRIHKTPYSNCKAEVSQYLTLMDDSGRWLGIYFGPMGQTRIWRKQIGSQPVLELETHLHSNQVSELQHVPSQVLRTLIYTDRLDSQITGVRLMKEEFADVHVGTVSRPKLQRQRVGGETINCTAKN